VGEILFHKFYSCGEVHQIQFTTADDNDDVTIHVACLRNVYANVYCARNVYATRKNTRFFLHLVKT